jgi:hypothetical protein
MATPVPGTLANNYNISYTNGSIRVGKSNATVTANSAKFIYTGTSQSVTGFTATGLVNGETTSVLTGVTASGATGVNVASYTNTVTGTDSNYNLTLINGSLAIAKAGLVVTADNKTRIYGDANPALTYTVTGYVNGENGSVHSGTPALSTTASLTSKVGSIPIVASANNLTADNYSFSYANAAMAIQARPITVSADANQTKVFFNPDPVLTYTLETNGVGRGLVGGDVFTGNLARASGEDVGSNYAILQGTLANENYKINFVPSTFEIKPPPTTFSVGTLMISIVSNNNFETSAPSVTSSSTPNVAASVASSVTPAEASKVSQINVTQTYAANSQAVTVITAQVPVAKINDFSIKIPDQIARNIISSGNKVTAQMVDGSELPSWLKFDPKTMEFKAQDNSGGASSNTVIRVSIKFGNETVVIEIKPVDILGKI